MTVRKIDDRKRWYQKLMTWYRQSDIQIPLYNSTARQVLKAKYVFEKHQLAKYSEKGNLTSKDKSKSVKYFFGFSSPRSGTVFLTKLLKKHMRDSLVIHEANIVDYLHFPRAIRSADEAQEYINNFRSIDILKRVNNAGVQQYVEINPFLRMHCNAIGEKFPNAYLFHIVRDGREVVRSVMSRDKLGPKDPIAKLIYPPIGDPYHADWKNMTRFERACWQWQFTNRFMRENIPNRLYFQKLVTDFNYFDNKINKVFGTDISREEWTQNVNSPRNVSFRYKMPHWKDWSESNTEIFNQICAEEMDSLVLWA